MSTENAALKAKIEEIREEALGSRGELYELHGSAIRSTLLPLAELLELNIESNPELVELTLINLFADPGFRATELETALEAKRAAAADGDPKGLWQFSMGFGRMGDLDSIFVARKSEIDAIIGKEVYFGEVLGKHSQVYGTVEGENFELISANPDQVEFFETRIGSTGHNPFDYLEEEV